MQEYYNSISEQKRIAFIDNLTDEQAHDISTRYPFAVCFANNVQSNNELPVIWFDGKRYGFTKVDQTPVHVGDTILLLNINQNGVLELKYEHQLIYIGEISDNTDNLTIPLNDKTTITTINNSSIQGYHLISSLNFNQENVIIDKNYGIILPTNYYLGFPIYNENNTPIEDPMWIRQQTITINNDSYYVWVYNNDDFGDIDNPNLLSIIYKQNNN